QTNEGLATAERSITSTTNLEEKATVISENGEKKQPLYELRSGRVQGAICNQLGPSGETRYCFSLYRSYTEEQTGNWQQTSSFEPEDLPRVKAIVAKAEETLTEELGQKITEGVTVTQRKSQKQSL